MQSIGGDGSVTVKCAIPLRITHSAGWDDPLLWSLTHYKDTTTVCVCVITGVLQLEEWR